MLSQNAIFMPKNKRTVYQSNQPDKNQTKQKHPPNKKCGKSIFNIVLVINVDGL